MQDLLNSLFFDAPIPSVDCSYEAPDRCAGTQPQGCCERLNMPSISGATTHAGLHHLVYAMIFTIMAAFALFFF